MINFITRFPSGDIQFSSKQYIFWGVTVLLTGFYWLPNYKVQAYVFHVMVLIPFLIFHWRKLLKFRYSKIHVVALFFILYSGVSSFWTIGDPIRPLFRGVLYAAFLWIYSVVIGWLFYEGGRSKYFNLFMRIMCAGGVMIGVFSVLIFYLQHPFSQRLEPFFSNENLIIFAQCLSLSGIMGLLLYKTDKNRFWLCCALLCFFLMLFSQTRGVLIGMAFAFGCFYLFSDGKHKFLIGSIFSVMMLFLTQVDIFKRLFNTESERWKIYGRVIEKINGHEVFGMGLMTNTDLATGGFGYPHSIFVTTYYTGGLVGLTLLMCLLVVTLWEAWLLARQTKDVTGLVLIANGIGIYLFDGAHLVSHPHGEWLFFWLPVMLIAAQSFHRRRPEMVIIR